MKKKTGILLRMAFLATCLSAMFMMNAQAYLDPAATSYIVQIISGVVIACGDRLFSGDTLFAGSCGRVDLPGGSAADMQRSLALVADLPLPDETTVYPGHESFTTLGQERRSNPYLMGEVF